MFHVLQTLSPHNVDIDAGIPARGLHGEAYRGHVFWDELFVFPVLTLRLPGLARAMLRYRTRRLDAARRAARAAGHAGAMYPWQSGSDGREESQRMHLNPRSGRWMPDTSSLQRHVGLAVAYNIWQYFQATADLEFLAEHGAETMLEVARFFAGLATYDAARDRFRIRGVMGPDEFSSRYPGAETPGLDDNAYTNVMTVWLLGRAHDVLAVLPTDASDRARRAARDHSGRAPALARRRRRMYVPIAQDGIISQFEGYRDLPELDWDDYRSRYGDIRRLDRILEAEGRSVDEFQASKQADVLMLFFVFSADELRALLTGLGYALPPEVIPRTIEYYVARTAHGSTLSALVHPGSWPGRTGRRHSSTSSRRCRATSPTCRAGRPPRVCTSARWPDVSICCSGASPGSRRGTTRSGSTPTGHAGSAGWSSPSSTAADRWTSWCPGARSRCPRGRAGRSGSGVGPRADLHPGESVRFTAVGTAEAVLPATTGGQGRGR